MVTRWTGHHGMVSSASASSTHRAPASSQLRDAASQMASHTKRSTWQAAILVFASLMDNVLDPTIVCYNSLMSAWRRSSNWQHVLEVFAGFEERRVEATDASYRVAMRACNEASNWRALLVLLQQMRRHRIQNIESANWIAASGLAKASQWEIVLQTFVAQGHRDERSADGMIEEYKAVIAACVPHVRRQARGQPHANFCRPWEASPGCCSQ
eukprot:TRINITY_DN29173_c0_g1_i2.p1 TRINITY_DN29173_c0_g1~~TRINITY_DN29173_c0_g1_i2.p1  ORF type:complete len:212 (+),score=21.99 TRINITY_DN29173_c0_g1_i2:186-821(+)